MNNTKIWIGIGAALLAGTSPQMLLAPAGIALPTGTAFAAGGEGGEGGGEGGAQLPQSFKLDTFAPMIDMAPQIAAYAGLVHETYARSLVEARVLRQAVDAFLAQPNEANLAAARVAWTSARRPYLETEAFRFYGGPIDAEKTDTTPEGPEGRINAWPLNEAVIDYVKGDKRAGLVNDRKKPVTRETILANDQVSDEADVTTGWHAVEFLLWGQDLSRKGPGARPAADYVPGKGNNDRRRAYLKEVTALLVDDLEALTAAWAPGKADNYAAWFLALDQREALGRILTGIATLAGFELPNERLSVALDSGDQEDEHSCFSDTTKQDFVHDARGIASVWTSVKSAVERVDAPLAGRIDAAVAKVEQLAQSLPEPFDEKVLRAKKGSPGRKAAEGLVGASSDLASLVAEAGKKLAVVVIVPTE